MSKIFLLFYSVCFFSFAIYLLLPWLLNELVVAATLALLLIAAIGGSVDTELSSLTIITWAVLVTLKVTHGLQIRSANRASASPAD